MNITLYLLAGWALFVTAVYVHLFYDINKRKLRRRWNQLFDAFTEEE